MTSRRRKDTLRGLQQLQHEAKRVLHDRREMERVLRGGGCPGGEEKEEERWDGKIWEKEDDPATPSPSRGHPEKEEEDHQRNGHAAKEKGDQRTLHAAFEKSYAALATVLPSNDALDSAAAWTLSEHRDPRTELEFTRHLLHSVLLSLASPIEAVWDPFDVKPQVFAMDDFMVLPVFTSLRYLRLFCARFGVTVRDPSGVLWAKPMAEEDGEPKEGRKKMYLENSPPPPSSSLSPEEGLSEGCIREEEVQENGGMEKKDGASSSSSSPSPRGRMATHSTHASPLCASPPHHDATGASPFCYRVPASFLPPSPVSLSSSSSPPHTGGSGKGASGLPSALPPEKKKEETASPYPFAISAEKLFETMGLVEREEEEEKTEKMEPESAEERRTAGEAEEPHERGKRKRERTPTTVCGVPGREGDQIHQRTTSTAHSHNNTIHHKKRRPWNGGRRRRSRKRGLDTSKSIRSRPDADPRAVRKKRKKRKAREGEEGETHPPKDHPHHPKDPRQEEEGREEEAARRAEQAQRQAQYTAHLSTIQPFRVQQARPLPTFGKPFLRSFCIGYFADVHTLLHNASILSSKVDIVLNPGSPIELVLARERTDRVLHGRDGSTRCVQAGEVESGGGGHGLLHAAYLRVEQVLRREFHTFFQHCCPEVLQARTACVALPPLSVEADEKEAREADASCIPLMPRHGYAKEGKGKGCATRTWKKGEKKRWMPDASASSYSRVSHASRRRLPRPPPRHRRGGPKKPSRASFFSVSSSDEEEEAEPVGAFLDRERCRQWEAMEAQHSGGVVYELVLLIDSTAEAQTFTAIQRAKQEGKLLGHYSLDIIPTRLAAPHVREMASVFYDKAADEEREMAERRSVSAQEKHQEAWRSASSSSSSPPTEGLFGFRQVGRSVTVNPAQSADSYFHDPSNAFTEPHALFTESLKTSGR